MKIKLSYHFFIMPVTALFFSVSIHAQSYDSTIIDSTTLIEKVSSESYDSGEAEEAYYPDTLISEYRAVVNDSVLAINNDKGFYYKRYMDSLLRATKLQVQKSNSPKPINIDTGFFSVLFWIVAVGLFAYLVYRLFLSDSFIFARNRKNISADIDMTAETATSDPDAMLINAINSGNYRLAVRYLYLQTLQRLSEKKFITINSNKTNYEYVNEVGTQKFANEFASLTLQYEYVWYGEYPLDDRLFNHIHEGFNQFSKNTSR